MRKIIRVKIFFEITKKGRTSYKSKRTNKKINPHEISRKVRDADVTINNWEIVINEIKREKFILQNVKLLGSMKNNIFGIIPE